jgi:predicted alpha/beta-fold hydrolase
MKKFEANREHLEFAELPNFKHKVPIVYFDPIVKNDETVILLYCGGLGATISYARMLNYDITNNNFFAFFERAGAGNNRNKTSRFPKYFVNEIKEVVAYLKRQIPNTKIFIIGES